MNNMYKGLACAGLMAAAVSTADAAIVNLDFTGAGSTVSYVLDVQSSPLGGSTIDITSATINGVSYDASNSILQMVDFEVTDFEIYDNNTEALISRLTFDGYFYTEAGVFATFYYGDQTDYSGSSYSFNSVIDSYTGNPAAMLYDQSGGLEMTSLSVNTVSAVPVPAAVWLFGSGLIGLVGFARRRA